MGIRFESGKPIFLQLEEMIRADIVAGRYDPGEKLPGVRDMALYANVNPNTMQRALSDLEEEGLLTTQGTSGRFVCEDATLIAAAKQRMVAELARDLLIKCKSLQIDTDDLIGELQKVRERGDDNE